jgi:uncharacterized protein YqgQ
MDIETLHAERHRVSANVSAIKTGEAEISQLLADEVLDGDDWDRAVLVLAQCREERKRLDDRLVHIDASIALLQRT